MNKKQMIRQQSILKEAAGYVRKGWTRNVYARDADGKEAGILTEHATSWCVMGAINNAAVSDGHYRLPRETRNALIAEIKKRGDTEEHFVTWNDTTKDLTGEAVATVLEKAADNLPNFVENPNET